MMDSLCLLHASGPWRYLEQGFLWISVHRKRLGCHFGFLFDAFVQRLFVWSGRSTGRKAAATNMRMGDCSYGTELVHLFAEQA